MSDSEPIKRPGRPKAPEPGSTISFWVPVSQHDQIVRAAAAREMSVSQFVGRALRQFVPPQSKPRE